MTNQMMTCSCGNIFSQNQAKSIGEMSHGARRLKLFNCPKCKSTCSIRTNVSSRREPDTRFQILLKIAILIVIVVYFTACANTSATSGKTAVKIGILGNSIACGVGADGFSQDMFTGAPYAESYTGQAFGGMLSGKSLGWTKTLSDDLGYGATIINLCGAGWDTGDQLGVYTQGSGRVSVNNNAAVLANLTGDQKLDYVMLPLQMNDWGHGQSLEFFRSNTETIIEMFEAKDIKVIMVLESPSYNSPDITVQENFSQDFVNFPGNYKFIMSAKGIAEKHGLETLDLFTPLHSEVLKFQGNTYGERMFKSGLFYGSDPFTQFHPNQRGHDIMGKAAVKFWNSKGVL